MKSPAWILASLVLAAAAAAPAASRGRDDTPPERTIPVTAKRFAFEPNEIHVRKGEAVTLAVTSEDVTHGFFSRPLHFDEDVAPGKTVQVRIAPAEAGTYTVICDHYCGSGHGGMKMKIVVE
jgi:cytochrome c oxidase subunit 2